jgi:hypothetical protein
MERPRYGVCERDLHGGADADRRRDRLHDDASPAVCMRPACSAALRLEGPDTRKSGTCDRPICEICTTSPAPEKDLCPEHARAWEAWKISHATG